MRDAPGTDRMSAGTGLVGRALDRLAGLEGRPVHEHVVVLDEVHRLLQDSLATLDEV